MSLIPDVASEALDFTNIKRRAVASRSYRVKISPSNMTTFTPGQTIYLDMPSNLAGTYVDFTQSYIKFNVSVTNAAYLDKCGAYGFIQRVQCVTSGQQLYDLNNYNVLMAALMDSDAAPGYKANNGNVLAGTLGNVPRGELIPAGATSTRTYCLPFALHPLAMQKKLVPLFSLDSLRFRLILDSAANVLTTPPGGTANTTYTITNVEFCAYFTELSPSAQAQIDALTGGVYNLLCPSYMNIQSTVPANQSALVATLGVAVSSLERIIVIHRNSSAIGSTDYFSLGARETNGLTRAQFFVNSEAYPMRPIELADAGAEPLAEYLISSHALSDFNLASNIQLTINASNNVLQANVSSGIYANPSEAAYALLAIPTTSNVSNAWNKALVAGSSLAGSAASGTMDVGSFLLAIELESGVSAGKSDRIYSGISTMASVVQYKGEYSGNTAAATVDFFCHYTVLLSLNMRTIGCWTISV
jgi:hypothetical protein